MTDIEQVDDQVKRVAPLLPFRVDLDADMAGTFVLQIDLGARGGVDDPHDTAGIDPGDDAARWWVDIEGGRKSLISDLGLDAAPETVAAWIAKTAEDERCPAAATGLAERAKSTVSASYPAPAGRTAGTTTGAVHSAPVRSALRPEAGHTK